MTVPHNNKLEFIKSSAAGLMLASATFISGHALAAGAQATSAPEKEAPCQVLFTNVNVFNGKDAKLIEDGSVLVEGNLIKAVSAEPIEAPDAYKVDGKGRTLMPGLIDMHSHMCIYNGLSFFRNPYDAQTVGAYTYKVGLDYLQQGFTTTRSAGCNDLVVWYENPDAVWKLSTVSL